MATATTISLPYKTPLSTIENTAIASWSGFVYQGLCALHHTLVLLKSDWDLAIGKYLSLEAYEDFAILDSASKIESLHQCKCYSSPSDFSDECKKMADKEFYWNDVDALYNMSSGQLVAVAVSFLLSLNRLYSKSKFIAIDDHV